MIDRPKFREMRYEAIRDIPEKYDIIQLKMDGIWGCMDIKDGVYKIYSRTGKIKAEGQVDNKELDATILGEYMFGSHWGNKMGWNGTFFAFDCLRYADDSYLHILGNEPLSVRLNYRDELLIKLKLDFVEPLLEYPTVMWQQLWQEFVIERGYEGVVFKDSQSAYGDKDAWARMKGEVEIEYVCTGFQPAAEDSKYEGLAGAVIGTLIDWDCEVKCGGLNYEMRFDFSKKPEAYIGQVFTAKGNGWYGTGAIRHPKFKGWRKDKSPEECTYDQIPEGIRYDVPTV